MEENHLNKPVYRSQRKKKKLFVKVMINKGKSTRLKMKMLKEDQNHKMWERKVRKHSQYPLLHSGNESN